MKIGLVSDSHGRIECLEVLERHFADADIIFHAGDFFADAVDLQQILRKKVIAVSGNCDFFSREPSEKNFKIAGIQVWLTHGHLYDVKNSYRKLVEKAKTLGAQVSVFGHTHFPAVFKERGIIFINPGSISRPRKFRGCTFGILYLRNGMASIWIYQVDGELMMRKDLILSKLD
jgi:hypothetical protein